MTLQGASPRWEPQIAVLCEAGQQYHPQHLSEEGRWTTDLNIKTPGTTCLRDKMDLLEHCKKVSYNSIYYNVLLRINPYYMQCIYEHKCIWKLSHQKIVDQK